MGMPKNSFSSLAEQVATTLRDGIQKGYWKKEMPGRNALAQEFGVNHKTVEVALVMLEKEGLLERQGRGRGRKILRASSEERRQLVIMILTYEKSDRKSSYLHELVHQLQTAGHIAKVTSKSMQSLGMQPKRIAKFVEDTDADAWIVAAGSGEVLDWFSRQERPAFALFGRMTQTDIAGTAPLKWPSYQKFISRLVELGHRRITMLVRSERRQPSPGRLEQYFLDQLEEQSIQIGPFNLPDWDDTPVGFHRCLDALFKFTPPTALIISQPELLVAAQQHLALKGIFSPRDVSLICSDASPVFDWCQPTIAHVRWDEASIVKRVVRWANQVSRGVNKRTQSYPEAEFVDGGTIGPAPRTP